MTDAAMSAGPQPLLKVEGLKTWFPVRSGVLQRVDRWVRAVDGVDLEIPQGQTLALVGESGCGKTTVGRSILRLEHARAGRVLYKDTDLLALSHAAMRPFRQAMQIVFQDPTSSLDPRMTVRDAIAEGLRSFNIGTNAAERTERVAELMTMVRLDPDHMWRYPHEFSGGQKQRICIARALAVEPKLLICDESVSALDVSIQAQILNLLRELQTKLGLTYLFITHDLGVVGHIADRVAVMYLGQIVETGDVTEIFQAPKHPYTKALLGSVPRLELDRRGLLAAAPGDPPDPANPPAGCRFHTRCLEVFAPCAATAPALIEADGRLCRCHLYDSAINREVGP
ncbi:MAG: ATP-binding cassette domain-containing protein [Alphaproteobacteria bacterium]|nr:ATP-binding cassette domain-containing protein [Alphaproteobacteria bacterium]